MDQPKWLAAAWAELGQREVAGAGNNPHISGYFGAAGHPETASDEVPWCAAFVGACLQRAGMKSTGSLMARSYLGWGQALEEGQSGAVAVLSRGGDPALGHVGFLIGETLDAILLLGGNQGDAVSVAAFPKTALLGLRWPEPAAAAPPPSEEDGFARALEHVLAMEGGWSDDPYDPGGPTNKGITLAEFAVWRGESLAAGNRAHLRRELKSIPDADVEAIYRARYWAPSEAGTLLHGLALMHFDAAVNQGVGTAKRMLQEAAGVEADGEFGPLTRAAILNSSELQLIRRYADVRRARYRALALFWRFGRGWLKRVDQTRARASDIARAGDSTLQQEKGNPAMHMAPGTPEDGKWWARSVTVWGTIVTVLSTVLPAVGPLIGFDITGDLIHQLGDGIVHTVQAVGGLAGTIMTIYGRIRATQPLGRRDISVKV